MTQALNPHVFPDGGYTFTDEKGMRFYEGSAAELAESVRAFRIRHGIPMGNPTQEITDQICARSPLSCREADASATRDAVASTRFGARVVRWIGRVADALSLRPMPPVHKDVAEARALVCMKCPRQISWKTGCGGCDSVARRLAISARKNKETKVSTLLVGCEVLSEDTRTSVWLEQKPSEDANLPENCWRRK